jgi:hypothetical protein
MITFDDDNITMVFGNGESRSYARTDTDGMCPFERQQAFEPSDNAWLRRIDDAMFANYYEHY